MATIDLQGSIRIAGGRQRITFSYNGLSLSVPERVRFRYKLTLIRMSEPSTAREAVYTNPDPNSHRFVLASNSADSGMDRSLPSVRDRTSVLADLVVSPLVGIGDCAYYIIHLTDLGFTS
jgi:hypothetical protein